MHPGCLLYSHQAMPISHSRITILGEIGSSSGRDSTNFSGFRPVVARGRGLSLTSLRYRCPQEGRFHSNCAFVRDPSMGGGDYVSPSPGVDVPRVRSKLADTDGIVIVDHGSRRAQSNSMLHEFVKLYKEKTGRPIVEAAHMELADPTISDAFDRCVERGASRIIISPYFLFPGRHWDKDIPSIVAEAAKKHPNIPYIVTAPIGLHELMVTVINDRMEYCLSQVASEVSECEMCAGSGRCKQQAAQESQSDHDSLVISSKERSSS
ncbi:hypothetical protein R1sor_005142 [Riccia sorocarpa]|uniref:Sirohydrochlorin ferrochelatase n=1 Tax=Riccia sorocarpa TaxID=122646 RepID=A0ABD3HKY2_9MARC